MTDEKHMTDEELLQIIKQTKENSRTELILLDKGLTRLPAEIGQLSKLRLLNLGNNLFKELHLEIWQLTNLRRLYLGGNRLEMLSPRIGFLQQLETLGFTNNYIEELPPELGRLTKLEVIYTEGNPLVSPPPEIIAQGAGQSSHICENDYRIALASGFPNL